MFRKHLFSLLLILPLFSPILLAPTTRPTAAATLPSPSLTADTTYYVSSTDGDDTNSGTSEQAPLQTIAAVNALSLQPGDQVLFKCGDTWRGEMLQITASGTQENPIVFGSYPENCTNQPVLSGAQPIGGWTQHNGSIYVADLSAGANAGLFPSGINQLFRNGTRLTLGRWPNLDANDNGGYSLVESAPDARTLVDSALPAGDWTGAMVHIKSMRWLLLNRVVAGSSGSTLTLAEDTDCWGGCGDPDPADPDTYGWGYFINNHLNTLDQDGEWYYDQATNRVYLFSAGGTPQSIEGSVILEDDANFAGGIILGVFQQNGYLSYVTIENFDIRNWFAHGITYPRNLEGYDNQHLTIQNNTIRNVESTGLNLATWVYQPVEGEDGWRGGDALTVSNNIIDGANHYGIDTYARNSTFRNNVVRNTGMVENLGASGLGCGTSGSNCTENGDGIRLKLDNPAYSAFNNTFRANRVERTAYCGFDVFGSNNTFENNVIQEACFVKGDCGGIRTFGRDSLSATNVHDLTIRNNIIVDTVGNTDGASSQYKALFGMGLYIDNYSRDITVSGNTIINSTVGGVLYQRSTGSITNNTLYNNNAGTMSGGQVELAGDETVISSMSGNILYGLKVNDEYTFAGTLGANSTANLLASDNNYFFQPYRADHIAVEGRKTLAEWQAYSGLDTHSTQNWFTLDEGDEPNSRIFYNDTNEPVLQSLGGRSYLDLDQNPVVGNITLEPFTSQVLIDNGVAPLTLSPTVLDFGEQERGTTSGAQPVTVQNTGTSPISLASITTSDAYAQTNNCPITPDTLAGGATCTINVSFAPTEAVTTTGVLIVTDMAGNLYPVDLTGTGVDEATGGQLVVAPTALDFGSLLVGTTSVTQTVTLTNTHTLSITISSIDTTGDYAMQTTCPTAPSRLGVGESCTVDLTFTPAATGSRSGSLTIVHDGPNTPVVVGLSGVGAGALAVTPTTLDLGNIPLGTTSPTETIGVENTGVVSITISSVTLTGSRFAQTHTCPLAPAVLAPGGTCAIAVTFTPAERGEATGSVTIVHDSEGSPTVITLAGRSQQPLYIPLIVR